MDNRKFKHLPHYISLISIFLAGILGFYIFSFDRAFQLAVVFALSLSYISWGVIHHTIHRDICLTIILEYIAVAILGAVMLISLIYRV
jgi:hypothetical protein